MGRRYIVPQDPESFAVRDIDQVLSIVQQNAADCVECLKRPRIRRVIQVQQSYELRLIATSAPTKRPFSFRGRKFIARAFRSGGAWCFGDGQTHSDHLQRFAGRLIRQFHPVDDVWSVRLSDVNDREAFLGGLLDVQVLLAAVSLEENLAHGSYGQRQVGNHSHRIGRRLGLMFCDSAGCDRDEK